MLTFDFIIFNKSILRQTTPSFSSSLIFLVPWSPKNFATFLTRNWTCDNFKCNLNELFSLRLGVLVASTPPDLPPRSLSPSVTSSWHGTTQETARSSLLVIPPPNVSVPSSGKTRSYFPSVIFDFLDKERCFNGS